MSSTAEQPTLEAAETVAPTPSSSLRAPDASSSSRVHPYAHARTNRGSLRHRACALQAKKSKHTELINPGVFDEQPKAILSPNGSPYAPGVAALESHYVALKEGRKELADPCAHRHQCGLTHRRARRHEPPAKPTAEQIALSKYRAQLLRYDDEYRDEILIYMHKCIVSPLKLALNF